MVLCDPGPTTLACASQWWPLAPGLWSTGLMASSGPSPSRVCGGASETLLQGDPCSPLPSLAGLPLPHAPGPSHPAASGLGSASGPGAGTMAASRVHREGAPGDSQGEGDRARVLTQPPPHHPIPPTSPARSGPLPQGAWSQVASSPGIWASVTRGRARATWA